MKYLFENKLAPLTYSMGFLQARFQDVLREALSWRRQIHPSVAISRVRGGLSDLLAFLEPITMPPQKELWVKTVDSHAAYFDNGRNGPDPVPVISYLSLRMRCRGLTVTCCPHTPVPGKKRGTHGAFKFELFGPDKTELLNYLRRLAVSHHVHRWVF